MVKHTQTARLKVSPSLKKFIQTAHPVDVAIYLEELSLAEVRELLLTLPVIKQAQIFRHIKPVRQNVLVKLLNNQHLVRLMAKMNVDDRVDVFNLLESARQKALLPAFKKGDREDIRTLSAYKEGTAGAIMTSAYATLNAEDSAQRALEKLRAEAAGKETIYHLFVIDIKGKLLGVLNLEKLLLAKPAVKIKKLMGPIVGAALLTDSQEEVAHKLSKYDLLALPILNDKGNLCGIVTYDDALDALEEEATEDFHKIGTVGKISSSVREAGFLLLYRKRIGWLILLVLGSVFSGAGLAFFESIIATHIALVFFLPLLIGSGGNAGAQASTLMVRALATGDVLAKDWAKMLGKEFIVAVALALTMACVITPLGVLRGGPTIAAIVGGAMVLIVLLGSIIGMILPFILNKLRLDPATASAPLVTTVCDFMGVVIYFSIASWVL